MRVRPPLSVEEIEPPRGRFGWVRRHPLLAFLIVVVLALSVPVGLGLHWWYMPSVPTTESSQVAKIEVILMRIEGDRPGQRQDEAHLTTADPALIQPLLDVFRDARRAEEHKCPNPGTIRIHRTDGVVEEMYILPGHDRPYYEYRFGSRINRVDREALLTALRNLGLSHVTRGIYGEE
jgi:hypothetical protein